MRALVLSLLVLGAGILIPNADAADLPGRLFFTPTERTLLDRARADRRSAAPRTENKASPQIPLGDVSLRGIIKSDGRTQLLINNELRDAQPGETVRDNSARITQPGGRAVEVKVGQRVNPYTGKPENLSSRETAEKK